MNRLQQIAKLRQELVGQGELASQVTAIRNASVEHLPELITMANQTLEQKLAKVYLAKNAEEARTILGSLMKGQKQVARSYSNALTEIGFDNYMSDQGIVVYPTRLEELIQHSMNLPPSGHPHLVHIDVKAEAIQESLQRLTDAKGDIAPAELVRAAHERVKETILQCEYGITGANCIVAENGVIIMAEDEGNVRAVSNLPYKHVAVIGIDKLVSSAEDGMAVVQAAAVYGVGRITPTYFSLVSGPSRTADIEFRMAYGMHGPKEVHIVLLDNGRTTIMEQGAGCLMKCIDCGACFEACTELANHQGWKDNVLTPKQISLSIVQGKIAKLTENATMPEFICPVGLTASSVLNSLAKVSSV